MNDHPTPPQPREPVPVHVVGQFSWGLTILFVLASVCWVLLPYTGSTFSALVFLLAIVLAGTRWNRGPVLAMGVVSALVWNFIFIPPRFTFHIEKPEDVVMFGMFFVVALSMGHLITQLREREAALEKNHREQEQLQAAVNVEASYWAVHRLIEEAEEQREELRGGRLPTLTHSIQLADVSFSYGDKPVLERFSMVARAGQLTVLSGASGAGKSSLLKILAGLEKPDDGLLQVQGDTARSRLVLTFNHAFHSQLQDLTALDALTGRLSEHAREAGYRHLELQLQERSGRIVPVDELVQTPPARRPRPEPIDDGVRR